MAINFTGLDQVLAGYHRQDLLAEGNHNLENPLFSVFLLILRSTSTYIIFVLYILYRQ